MRISRCVENLWHWTSYWCHRVTEGAKFWISCKGPAFLSNFSRLQLIQNSAPFFIRRGQCDIWMEIFRLPSLNILGKDRFFRFVDWCLRFVTSVSDQVQNANWPIYKSKQTNWSIHLCYLVTDWSNEPDIIYLISSYKTLPQIIPATLIIHNGWNDLYKRQFFGFGSALPILEIEQFVKFFSCQIDWCYKLLTTIWQKIVLLK